MRTSSPSGTEVESRMTATSRNDTMAPANRAETSMTCPMWERSLVPIATTSPVETLRGRVPPRWTAWRPTSCTVRYAATSQLVTANRCRMIPVTAWTSPRASITAAYVSSAEPSLAATPRSMARPMTAGITAWQLIQTMPNAMPPARVRHWPLAIHHRKAPGELCTAVPGWSRGRRRTAPRYGAGDRSANRLLARPVSSVRVPQEASAKAIALAAPSGLIRSTIWPGFPSRCRLTSNAVAPPDSANAWASQRAGHTGSGIAAPAGRR